MVAVHVAGHDRGNNLFMFLNTVRLFASIVVNYIHRPIIITVLCYMYWSLISFSATSYFELALRSMDTLLLITWHVQLYRSSFALDINFLWKGDSLLSNRYTTSKTNVFETYLTYHNPPPPQSPICCTILHFLHTFTKRESPL